MTNTNDFRRYSYSTDTSYAIEAFSAARTSAAPAYSPRRKAEPGRDLRVHENQSKKSKKQLEKEQAMGFVSSLKVLGIAAVCLIMAFSVLHSYVQKNELSHEISSIKSEISTAQSENTRLNAQLDSLVSMSQIDQYAVEKLGMTKMQANQIHYIDVEEYKEQRQNAMKDKTPAQTAKELK